MHSLHSRAMLLGACLLAATLGAAAQRPPRASGMGADGNQRSGPQSVQGVLEPVSYSEDIQLNSVYFVTVDEGWVSGGNGIQAGVLLHTADAGGHWTVALGDPAGSQRPFSELRFVDQTTGFVVQGTQVGQHALLRTTDGQTWRVSGTIPAAHTDYRFVSATTGVVASGSTILRTTDAGRSWTPVFNCVLKVQVQGLTRNTTCHVTAFAFPTPNVGYAIGGGYEVRGIYSLKTEDGGATWTAALAVPGPDDGYEAHVFFTDEKNGYLCLADGKLFGTDDGAQTWTGLPGASCESKAPILFADPEVGWALRYTTLTWTTEGGRRWVSRKLALPALANAFSLPRRDRAYLVGDHGMVYRYRVAPADTPIAQGIAAPAMPSFSPEIVDRTTAVARELAGLDSNLAAPSSSPSASGTVTPAGSRGAPLAPFIAGCCGKRMSNLERILDAVSTVVPDYTSRYKNLNLLTLGVRIAGTLPARADSLRAAVTTFRSAPDRASADQALAGVKLALAALRAVADTAVQVRP